MKYDQASTIGREILLFIIILYYLFSGKKHTEPNTRLCVQSNVRYNAIIESSKEHVGWGCSKVTGIVSYCVLMVLLKLFIYLGFSTANYYAEYCRTAHVSKDYPHEWGAEYRPLCFYCRKLQGLLNCQESISRGKIILLPTVGRVCIMLLPLLGNPVRTVKKMDEEAWVEVLPV